MDIMTILIIVCSVVGIVALTYSIKSNKQIEQIYDDREEFYSSDCDESLIEVYGFTADKDTREIVEWKVRYGSANISVYNNNLDMSKYLTQDQTDYVEIYQGRKDSSTGVYWIYL